MRNQPRPSRWARFLSRAEKPEKAITPGTIKAQSLLITQSQLPLR